MHREFSVGDHVYLKVKAKKISLKLGSCAKLSPRYCGSFEVLERIGPVSYRLAFPASTIAHSVFHVSLLKKYVHDPNHVINSDVIQVEPKGEFQVEPMHIIGRKAIMLRNVTQVKVQWKHFGPDGATSDFPDDMRKACPLLFNFEEHKR